VYILCPRRYGMRHEQTLLYSFSSELPRIQVVQLCSSPTSVFLALYHVPSTALRRAVRHPDAQGPRECPTMEFRTRALATFVCSLPRRQARSRGC